MSAVLRIEKLTKDYRQGFKRARVRALDHLSLEVHEGEIFGFLGPNGAGKTTTIKLLLDLIRPTDGKAWVFGEPMGSPELKRRIGYMPENPYFYRFLTAWEFLDFYGKIAGLHAGQRKERAQELLNLVGLSEARNKRIGEFSKGMVQRVGLAQAMLNDPKMILMDEPLSGLDPIGRREMRTLIERFREQGKTIFFCSHVLSDVETLCDRVAILHRGKLIKVGKISEIVEAQTQEMEVALAGWKDEDVKALEKIADTVHTRGDLMFLRCQTEKQVRDILDHTSEKQLTVHSVTPVRQSLEDYFVKEIEQQKAGSKEAVAQ